MSCKRFVRLIAYQGFYVLLAFVITTFFLLLLFSFLERSGIGPVDV